MARKAKTRDHLSEIQRIAKRRGGQLLSSAYLGDLTKLRWRCGEGHEWEASPGKIKQDRWCPTCGRKKTGAAKRTRAEAQLRRRVAQLSGTILSTEYVNSQTKLRYRCWRGHEWEAVPSSVLMGTWCRACGSARVQIGRRAKMLERARKIVRERGGKLLTPEVASSAEPITVRCAEGHEWTTLPASLDAGTWCPHCKEDEWLLTIQVIAKEQGGRCISDSCVGWDDKVVLECAQGHRWQAAAVLIKRGSWCHRCRRMTLRNLELMREMARERGGECLSKAYVNSDTHLQWICAEGHEWRAKPHTIVQGFWCRECRRGFGRPRRALTIEIMKEMARERGGECLSERYEGIYSKLRWRCAAGHEWVTVANNVRRGGWCPQCSHAVHGTLERMRELAIRRGGRCLTRAWNDHRRPLQFACSAGHRFRLRSTVIKTGVWCEQCASTARPKRSAGR